MGTTEGKSEAIPDEIEDNTAAGAENQNADPEAESDEEKDMSALYVIIAIIVILVVIGIVMYGLHYKGKLPQTFYNLGRRQWKFVQGNEEFPVIDDDEKKHPEIVKNGKKLENGGDDVSPMGDSANVNPALTEVTWTAEEKKANGNGTAVNGTGNGTAPAPAESTETTEATEAKKEEKKKDTIEKKKKKKKKKS